VALTRVLDAGCGRGRRVDFGEAYVVGIDIAEYELGLNESLDERIVGDIQTYPLEPSSFDTIYCQDLLEHLPHPKAALHNMFRALRPGGTMHIGLPNLVSPKGLVTKFTPLRFHVWVYRNVFGRPWAGSPGYGPYKTYLRWSVRPNGIARLAIQEGLEVREVELYEEPYFTAFWASRRTLWRLVKLAWRLVPGGANPALTECRITLAKPTEAT